GKAIPGQYEVKVTRPGYFDKTISFDFENGVTLNPVIELRPFPAYPLNGKVEYDTQAGVPFARVIAFGPKGTYETIADANGNFFIPAIFEGPYELQAGIWGYTYEAQINMNQPQNLTLQVSKGYKDDFDLDLGWTVGGQVITGAWTRDVPIGQYFNNNWLCGSEGDSPFDSGKFAYSTGPSGSPDVTDSEVNGGTTWLISPPMDWTNTIDPYVKLDSWICEFPPNQYQGAFVWITNGVDTIQLDYLHNDTITGSWQPKEYNHIALSPPLDSVRVMISARDTTTGSNFYVLKVQLDHFEAAESGTATTEIQNGTGTFLLFPNPVSGSTVYLKPQRSLKGQQIDIRFVDLEGRVQLDILKSTTDLAGGMDIHLMDGMYFVQWHSDQGESGIEKLLVLNQK
ncbi:MAG TPA: carboxypeptidase-like regulatory domain-containing protein, partial [Saprospiraceae bacterium]|nr:carboxypeptidase-like regulatory domain-containing protein [Saprospiraceae bacterium]